MCLELIVIFLLLFVSIISGKNCLVFLFMVEIFYWKLYCIVVELVVLVFLGMEILVLILNFLLGNIFVIFCGFLVRFKDILVRRCNWLVERKVR